MSATKTTGTCATATKPATEKPTVREQRRMPRELTIEEEEAAALYPIFEAIHNRLKAKEAQAAK